MVSRLYSAIGVSLSFISGLWIPATLLCCIPWVQRQMLYLHNITMFPGKWLDEPERAGFLKNQVMPFRIATKDGESLFAWLIAPLGVYSNHSDELIHEQQGVADVEDRLVFKLLRNDPEARLLIYFHGNAGTIAQTRRTLEYRAYSAGAPDKIFVLAFDYRGFGQSSGIPSESGLLNDAEAIIDWAMNTCRISPDRIVLLGHSLGTAVVAGTSLHYADIGIEFAGLILCAGFTNAGNAFSAYTVANVFPILAPVKTIPAIQAWFSRKMRDTWTSDERLANLIRRCTRLRIVLMHAEDDQTMPWNQTEELFKSTLAAAIKASPDDCQKKLKVVDMGEAGRQETWLSDAIRVEKLVAKHGGHNTFLTLAPIALAILQQFGLGDLTAPLTARS